LIFSIISNSESRFIIFTDTLYLKAAMLLCRFSSTVNKPSFPWLYQLKILCDVTMETQPNVPCNGITSIQNFIQIYQLVQKLLAQRKETTQKTDA
jgi:hypothetical protein